MFSAHEAMHLQVKLGLWQTWQTLRLAALARCLACVGPLHPLLASLQPHLWAILWRAQVQDPTAHQPLSVRYLQIIMCEPASPHFAMNVFPEASWRAGSFDPVFKFTALLYLIGTMVWNRFCTGEVVFS